MIFLRLCLLISCSQRKVRVLRPLPGLFKSQDPREIFFSKYRHVVSVAVRFGGDCDRAGVETANPALFLSMKVSCARKTGNRFVEPR